MIMIIMILYDNTSRYTIYMKTPVTKFANFYSFLCFYYMVTGPIGVYLTYQSLSSAVALA